MLTSAYFRGVLFLTFSSLALTGCEGCSILGTGASVDLADAAGAFGETDNGGNSIEEENSPPSLHFEDLSENAISGVIQVDLADSSFTGAVELKLKISDPDLEVFELTDITESLSCNTGTSPIVTNSFIENEFDVSLPVLNIGVCVVNMAVTDEGGLSESATVTLNVTDSSGGPIDFPVTIVRTDSLGNDLAVDQILLNESNGEFQSSLTYFVKVTDPEGQPVQITVAEFVGEQLAPPEIIPTNLPAGVEGNLFEIRFNELPSPTHDEDFQIQIKATDNVAGNPEAALTQPVRMNIAPEILLNGLNQNLTLNLGVIELPHSVVIDIEEINSLVGSATLEVVNGNPDVTDVLLSTGVSSSELNIGFGETASESNSLSLIATDSQGVFSTYEIDINFGENTRPLIEARDLVGLETDIGSWHPDSDPNELNADGNNPNGDPDDDEINIHLDALPSGQSISNFKIHIDYKDNESNILMDGTEPLSFEAVFIVSGNPVPYTCDTTNQSSEGTCTLELDFTQFVGQEQNELRIRVRVEDELGLFDEDFIRINITDDVPGGTDGGTPDGPTITPGGVDSAPVTDCPIQFAKLGVCDDFHDDNDPPESPEVPEVSLQLGVPGQADSFFFQVNATDNDGGIVSIAGLTTEGPFATYNLVEDESDFLITGSNSATQGFTLVGLLPDNNVTINFVAEDNDGATASTAATFRILAPPTHPNGLPNYDSSSSIGNPPSASVLISDTTEDYMHLTWNFPFTGGSTGQIPLTMEDFEVAGFPNNDIAMGSYLWSFAEAEGLSTPIELHNFSESHIVNRTDKEPKLNALSEGTYELEVEMTDKYHAPPTYSGKHTRKIKLTVTVDDPPSSDDGGGTDGSPGGPVGPDISVGGSGTSQSDCGPIQEFCGGPGHF